jgi:hypothetical protein
MIELLGITGIPSPRATEKTFDGFYLALTEGIIFCVPDSLIISSRAIIEGECMISILDNGNEFDLFNKF